MSAQKSNHAKISKTSFTSKKLGAGSAAASSSSVLKVSQAKKLEELYKKKYWFEHGLFAGARDASGKIPGWYMAAVVWPILIFLVLLLLTVMVFFIWLSTRFKFVWLHAVQTEEVLVRRPLSQYENQSDSLTSFYILMAFSLLIYFAAILVPAGMQFFAAARVGVHVLTDYGFLWKYFWPLIALFLFSVLIAVIFYSVITDFIIPLMASEQWMFKEAFRKWLAIYKKNRMAVCRYFLTKFFASILVGAFSMAALVIAIILGVIAGVIIFEVLYLLLFMLLKAKILFWVLAVILGTPFLIAMIFMLMACMLPAAVFFRAFSLSFLSRLAPE